MGRVGAACERQAFLRGTCSYIAPVLAPCWGFILGEAQNRRFPTTVAHATLLAAGNIREGFLSGPPAWMQKGAWRLGCCSSRARGRAVFCQDHTAQRAAGAASGRQGGSPLLDSSPGEASGFLGSTYLSAGGHLRGTAELFLMYGVAVFCSSARMGAICSATCCAQAPAISRRAVCCRVRG